MSFFRQSTCPIKFNIKRLDISKLNYLLFFSHICNLQIYQIINMFKLILIILILSSFIGCGKSEDKKKSSERTFKVTVNASST